MLLLLLLCVAPRAQPAPRRERIYLPSSSSDSEQQQNNVSSSPFPPSAAHRQSRDNVIGVIDLVSDSAESHAELEDLGGFVEVEKLELDLVDPIAEMDLDEPHIKSEQEEHDFNFLEMSPICAAAARPPSTPPSPPSPSVSPCPTLCGGYLAVRRRKRDDSPFFACTGYPTCKYTEPWVDPEKRARQVPLDVSNFTWHTTGKKKLKSTGRVIEYKDCAQKKRHSCGAKLHVDVESGED